MANQEAETAPQGAVPLDCRVRRLPEWHKHSERDYITADPFFGDESSLECRTVNIRKAKKNHLCYGLDGKMNHGIQAGSFYRYETAFVDGSFWGKYRICLGCMDELLRGT